LREEMGEVGVLLVAPACEGGIDLK